MTLVYRTILDGLGNAILDGESLAILEARENVIVTEGLAILKQGELNYQESLVGEFDYQETLVGA